MKGTLEAEIAYCFQFTLQTSSVYFVHKILSMQFIGETM